MIDPADCVRVAFPVGMLGGGFPAETLWRGAALGARAFMKERVAAYKYPRVIWLVDELPEGPTSKILKREIEVPAIDAAKAR